MNRIGLVAAIAATFLMAPPTLAEATAGSPTRTKDVPTKVESYYRVKWGSLKDFVALYERNHQPLLEEMRKEGFILDMKSEFAFLHMAAGPRWDMRVTSMYRDAAAALNDPAWEEKWSKARERLYKDLNKLQQEEAQRFALLEEHWDVVVSNFPE